MLPEYISGRPKKGFCGPIAAWATSLLTQRDGTRVPVDQGLVVRDAFEGLRRDRSVGPSFALWALRTLEHWCERKLVRTVLGAVNGADLPR